MTVLAEPTWAPMTPDERDRFDRDGYLIIPSVLDEEEVAYCRAAIMRARQRVGATRALHLLSAVRNVPELAFLVDHPRTLRYVWSMLGWNVHVYHSHVDVHPQLHARQPIWWHWHQDGGRHDREPETGPGPRTSVKLAYWLSDVSRTGRGNVTMLRGSHRTSRLPGQPRRDVPGPAPEGAVQVTAEPGDVVVFDRRLWHARSDNHSELTRVAAFFGYTYRWVAGRDETPDLAGLTPVQRQLLGHRGDGGGDHLSGHDPATTPLHGELARRGLLHGGVPALVP